MLRKPFLLLLLDLAAALAVGLEYTGGCLGQGPRALKLDDGTQETDDLSVEKDRSLGHLQPSQL